MIGMDLYKFGDVRIAYGLPTRDNPHHNVLFVGKNEYSLGKGVLKSLADTPVSKLESKLSELLPGFSSSVGISELHGAFVMAYAVEEKQIRDLAVAVVNAAQDAARMVESCRPGPDFYSPEPLM